MDALLLKKQGHMMIYHFQPILNKNNNKKRLDKASSMLASWITLP